MFVFWESLLTHWASAYSQECSDYRSTKLEISLHHPSFPVYPYPAPFCRVSNLYVLILNLDCQNWRRKNSLALISGLLRLDFVQNSTCTFNKSMFVYARLSHEWRALFGILSTSRVQNFPLDSNFKKISWGTRGIFSVQTRLRLLYFIMSDHVNILLCLCFYVYKMLHYLKHMHESEDCFHNLCHQLSWNKIDVGIIYFIVQKQQQQH